MQLILREDINNLGRAGELVTVKPGYGRNYLLPKGLAVHATPSSGGMYTLRVKLRQRVPGEARNAIAACFGALTNVKHVFVVDPDVDIFSDEQMDWALATRFQEENVFKESIGEFGGTVIVTTTWMPRLRRAASRAAVATASAE